MTESQTFLAPHLVVVPLHGLVPEESLKATRARGAHPPLPWRCCSRC